MDHKLVCCSLVFAIYFISCKGTIIETIQNESGDTYDCVNIKLQPAFQHPLLQNHTIQMKPTSYPKYMSEVTPNNVSSNSEIETVACPQGTIPIWRNPVKNHTSSKQMSHSWDLSNKNISINDKEINLKAYLAGIIIDGSFFGSKASMSIYEPDIGEGVDRASGAWNSFSNGVKHTSTYDTISAGWAVWPKFSGDKHSRFVIQWLDSTRSEEEDVCVNLLCPGFVQVSSDIPLGARLQPVSSYGGAQFRITIHIFKDPTTGDWWLAFGENKKMIGYWPKSLFKYLNTEATRVGWGGWVHFPPNDLSPPMGSGHFSSEGFKKAAFFENTVILDKSNNPVVPNIDPARNFVTTKGCYDVGGYGFGSGGIGFYFGGPSGCTK